MKCSVCRSDRNVQEIGNLYIIGSEGIQLCPHCRNMVSQFICDLRMVNGKGFKDGFSRSKKLNQNQG